MVEMPTIKIISTSMVNGSDVVAKYLLHKNTDKSKGNFAN